MTYIRLILAYLAYRLDRKAHGLPARNFRRWLYYGNHRTMARR